MARLGAALHLGVLLVLVMLTVTGVGCEYRICDRHADTVSLHTQAHHSDMPVPLPDAPERCGLDCALHCGVVLLPLLFLVVAPSFSTRVTLCAPAFSFGLRLPPLLPPPEAA
nr:hypothetical protein [Oscillochloris trichoides]